jgi:hypothetical protein
MIGPRNSWSACPFLKAKYLCRSSVMGILGRDTLKLPVIA